MAWGAASRFLMVNPAPVQGEQKSRAAEFS
jgi:hypothetical protein